MKITLIKQISMMLIIVLLSYAPVALMEAETPPDGPAMIEKSIEEMNFELGGDEEGGADSEAFPEEPVSDPMEADAASTTDEGIPTFTMIRNCQTTMRVGDRLQLVHGNLKALSYSSSDRWTVASCDKGLITAKKVGTTKITARFSANNLAVLTLIVTDPTMPTSVRLDQPASTRLDVNSTLQLTARILPASAESDLKWTSSADGIAGVDDFGLVTPRNTGTVTITVTTLRGNKKDSIRLTITDNTTPTRIILNKSGTVNLDLSSTLLLKATLSPTTASSAIIWKSSNAGVATVSNGRVTPVNTGTTTITATTVRGNRSDRVTVRVTDHSLPTKITLTPSGKYYLDLHESITLGYKLYPNGARSAVSWKSNASGVASVSGGRVTPHSLGSATITATTARGGKKASIKIYVVDKHAPTGIKIASGSKKNIRVGVTRTMAYTVSGWKGYETRKRLTWTSSNPSVLQVVNASKGIFKSLKIGTARVTVTTDNGKKDSFVLKVVK